MPDIFDTKIEFAKGVGPQKAVLLNKELNIFTFADIIQHYPFRYEDRTKFYDIKNINSLVYQSSFEEGSGSNAIPAVQIKGTINRVETIGQRYKKRLVAHFSDNTGSIELIWFQGISWIIKKLKPGVEYVVFGKPSVYGRKINIAHPEIELTTKSHDKASYFQPVYSTTEKLKSRFLDSKAIGKIILNVLTAVQNHIKETLPEFLLSQNNLIGKLEALFNIHYPQSQALLQKAQFRLKFEELFYIQLRLLKLKIRRSEKFKGQIFENTGLLNDFYHQHLPFELTQAQKKVIKEIFHDLKTGKQMNRLLQGDVGSGKTIVSFICMLIVIGSSGQTVMMAPTEILAEQHFRNLKKYADLLQIRIAILTGSSKTKERKLIHQMLKSGDLSGIPGYRARIRPIVSRITIHWPSFYNVVTGKTLALPNLIALQHIPLSPAGVIAKRPAPIALPNSCAAEWRMAPDAVFSPYASVRYFTPHMVHSQYNLL